MASTTPEELYAEQFRSAGVMPSGPISPWPQGREIKTMEEMYHRRTGQAMPAKKVTASLGTMAKGLVETAGHAIRNGKVSQEIRQERFATCLACPHYVQESSRCSLCGCYMKAKTWVDGPPQALCPAKKWDR